MNLGKSISAVSCLGAFLLAAPLFFGCSDILPDDIMSSYPVKVGLTDGLINTRISVDASCALHWESGDRVAMCALTEDGNVSGRISLDLNPADASLSRATFNGTIKLPAVPSTCLFVYPESAAVADGGIIEFSYDGQSGEHQPYVYGYCDYNVSGMECTMQHVGGMVHLKAPEDVVSVTVKGNSGEPLSSFTCNYATGEVAPAADAKDEFSVEVSGGEAYFCMPPVSFSKGFSLVCKASDGTVMYKSYSAAGTADSGYDFAPGTFVEIAFDSYVKFDVSAAASAVHTKDSEGRLDGTAVSVSFTRQGAPGKVMFWGAEVVNPDGAVVRTIAELQGSVPEATMSVADGWAYLPQGTYTLRPYYVLYGVRVDLPASEVAVPAPEFDVTIGGYTSYDKYLASEIDAANGCGNSTVYDIAAYVGIADALLSDSRYSGDVNCYYDDVLESSALSSVVSVGSKSGQSWAAHTFRVSATFDGVTKGAYREFHVTGLPYYVNLIEEEDSQWVLKDKAEFSNGILLYATMNGNYSAYALSPLFYLPERTNIIYTSGVALRYTGLSSGNLNFCTGITTSETMVTQFSHNVTKYYSLVYYSTPKEYFTDSGSLIYGERICFSHNNPTLKHSIHYFNLLTLEVKYSNER